MNEMGKRKKERKKERKKKKDLWEVIGNK